MPSRFDRINASLSSSPPFTTAAATATTSVTKLAKLNEAPIYSSAPDDSVEIYQQCDYGILFSHLPLSFHFEPIIETYKNVINGFTASSPSSVANRSTSFSSKSNFLDSSSIFSSTDDFNSNYIQLQQQSNYKLCIASVCILFGFFFALAGYRLLKLSTFIIGFFLGSSVIYLILSEQKQLSLVENLIISLSIGVLFAFVALLVQYIGLFLLGITSSTAIVTCILIFIDLFYTNKSAWLCIGLLFMCATLVASFSLRFQRFFAILNTSCIGSALLMNSLDFFVENNLLLEYIYELFKVNGIAFNIYQRSQKSLYRFSKILNADPSERSKLFSASSDTSFKFLSSTTRLTTTTATTTTTTSTSTLLNSVKDSMSNSSSDSTNDSQTSGGALALFLRIYTSAHDKLCWYTWLIFGSFFVLLISSLLIQYLITAKHYDHRDTWQRLIRGNRKKKSANLEKMRIKSDLKSSSSSSATSGGAVASGVGNVEGTNDTLLLVETSNHRSKHRHHHQRHHHHHHRHHDDSRKHHRHHRHRHREGESSEHSMPNSSSEMKKHRKRRAEITDTENANANVEIVSFEVIKPVTKKSRSGEQKLSHQKLTKNPNSSTDSSTSTTSSSSSASSTCQLIHNEHNNTESGARNLVLPSAPPLPLSPIPTTQHQTTASSTSSTCLTKPPPVPTVPPPRLTDTSSLSTAHSESPQMTLAKQQQESNNIFSLIDSTSNSTAASNSINSNNSFMPNIARMKHHRPSCTGGTGVFPHNSGKDKDLSKSGDKFRQLYQIRRNNGDVLSLDFMNNIQTKLQSSSTNLNNSLKNQQSSHHSPHPTGSLTNNVSGNSNQEDAGQKSTSSLSSSSGSNNKKASKSSKK